jgi:hypothetical protein
MVILRHVKGGVRFGVEACTHIGPREIGSVYDKHITDKTKGLTQTPNSTDTRMNTLRLNTDTVDTQYFTTYKIPNQDTQRRNALY